MQIQSSSSFFTQPLHQTLNWTLFNILNISDPGIADAETGKCSSKPIRFSSFPFLSELHKRNIAGDMSSLKGNAPEFFNNT